MAFDAPFHLVGIQGAPLILVVLATSAHSTGPNLLGVDRSLFSSSSKKKPSVASNFISRIHALAEISLRKSSAMEDYHFLAKC